MMITCSMSGQRSRSSGQHTLITVANKLETWCITYDDDHDDDDDDSAFHTAHRINSHYNSNLAAHSHTINEQLSVAL